jgi:hypothetical protein
MSAIGLGEVRILSPSLIQRFRQLRLHLRPSGIETVVQLATGAYAFRRHLIGRPSEREISQRAGAGEGHDKQPVGRINGQKSLGIGKCSPSIGKRESKKRRTKSLVSRMFLPATNRIKEPEKRWRFHQKEKHVEGG